MKPAGKLSLSVLSVKIYPRFIEVRSGRTKLVGILDRKWESDTLGGNPIHLITRLYFIRVEGLPFIIKSSQYQQVSEGDSVRVTFWPAAKRVDQIEQEIVPGTFENI